MYIPVCAVQRIERGKHHGLCYRDERHLWKYFRDVTVPGGPSPERNQQYTGIVSNRDQHYRNGISTVPGYARAWIEIAGTESAVHRDMYQPGSTKHTENWMYIHVWALEHMERGEHDA